MTNEVKCWCRHCKTELPPSHTGPCPECGKSGKDCKVSASVAIGLAVSYNVQKVHEYTKKHPWFITISVALTIVALIVGYLLGNLAGLLIGIIVAILNWWLTPHAIKTVVEITSWGDKARETRDAKAENNTQQPKSYSHKDIYSKLENIENAVESGTQIQKFGILYALGVAFVILGFSLWPGLLERLGLDPTKFYANSIVFIVLGIIAMIYAYTLSRQKKNKG